MDHDADPRPLPPVAEVEQCMAMPAVAPHRWSAQDVRALPDDPGRRVECVDGELLVSPSPRLPHQSAVGALFRALDVYVRTHGIGTVVMAPSDLELDPFTLVQPDLFVLPLVNGRLPQSVEEAGTALLLVEVLSPTTARADRVVKRQRDQRYGVGYWIGDLDARLVERWRPAAAAPEVCTETLVWDAPSAPASCTLALAPLFAEVLGEAQPPRT
jgi:Uma2 family endonuclease